MPLWLKNWKAKNSTLGSKWVVVLLCQSSHIQPRVLPAWEILLGVLMPV